VGRFLAATVPAGFQDSVALCPVAVRFAHAEVAADMRRPVGSR